MILSFIFWAAVGMVRSGSSSRTYADSDSTSFWRYILPEIQSYAKGTGQKLESGNTRFGCVGWIGRILVLLTT
jgi:hypothetical protein